MLRTNTLCVGVTGVSGQAEHHAKHDWAKFHRRRPDGLTVITCRSHVVCNRKWYDVIGLGFLFQVRRGIHRGRGNGGQRPHPVRHGGLETAQEAGADIQPECSWSLQLSLSGHHLRCKAVQCLPFWHSWLLAVHDIFQRKSSLVWHHWFHHQPCGHYRRALSESCPCCLEQEQAA